MTLFGHYGDGLNPNYERLRDSEDASNAEQKAYATGSGPGTIAFRCPLQECLRARLSDAHQ